MIGREMRLLDIYMDGWMGYIKCVYMVPEMHGYGIVSAKAAALQTSDERNIGQNNNTLDTSLLLLKER